MTFSTLNLSPALLAALPSQIESPTEIQTLTIPIVTSGKDILATAQTGSGKTFAYGLALLEKIKRDPAKAHVLVLLPTRELANQVTQALSSVAKKLDLQVITLSGGIDKDIQIEQLKSSPEIIVATPGRLLDLINTNELELTRVNSVVLDEADRLLDMGFWPDVQRILEQVPHPHQTLLFSATMPDTLESLVKNILKQPVSIQANKSNSVVEQIEEQLFLVNKGSKANALIHLIKQHQWQQVLVFIGARDNADALVKKLTKAGIHTAALHGNKQQNEREQTLESFKDKKIQVLIATDILARGIHVDLLPAVINAELPADPTVYVHRVGRTARAGEEGLAISLVCHGETDYLQAIRDLTQRALPLQELAEFPVTDKPSTGEGKRAPRDKQANRRTTKKTSIKQFKGKPKR